MKELSFYFFQCVNLRILANSTEIELYIVEDYDANTLELIIKDNGVKYDIRLLKDDAFLKKSLPALHFLKTNNKENGGNFEMLSHNLTGNLISLRYPLQKSARLAFGKVASLLTMLFVTHPQIQFIFSQMSRKGEFVFDSLQFLDNIGKIDMEDKDFLFHLKDLIEMESAAIQEFA